MWKSAKEFFQSVGRWWVVVFLVLVGDVVGNIATYFQAWVIPIWVLVATPLVALGFAFLLAFHKVRTQRDALLTKIDTLNAQLDGRARLVATATALGGHLTAAHELLRRNVKCEAECQQWKQDADVWLNAAFQDITSRLSPAHAAVFVNVQRPAATFGNSFNELHNGGLISINAHAESLKTILTGIVQG